MEETLIILKPDCIGRGLVGQVLSRFEVKGLDILNCRLLLLSRGLVMTHYEEHKNKEWFESLITFMTSNPVMIIKMRGVEAVKTCRMLIGNIDRPGTIRGDFVSYADLNHNLVHGSDSVISAKKEIELFSDLF